MSYQPPRRDDHATIASAIQEITEKTQLLVKDEIELAKTEVTLKAKTLGKGAAVGAAAGVFLVFAVVMLLNTLAWFFVDLLDITVAIWVGFLIVTLILVVLGAVAGLLAKRWLSSGPPTPDMAIGEAKAMRDQLEHQKVERDQLGRSLEREKAQD